MPSPVHDPSQRSTWAKAASWLVSMLFTVLAVAGAGAVAVAMVLFFPGTNRVEPAAAAQPEITTTTVTTTTTSPVSESSTTSIPETSTTAGGDTDTTTSTSTTVPADSPPGALFAVPLVPYRVERDDTLASIAARFELSVADLASLNDIPDTVEPGIGTVLLVPGGDEEQRLVPAVLAENPERAQLIEVFQRWAETYRVPAELLMAVAWQASQWDDQIVGDDGKIGVTQLTPELASWIGENLVGIPLDPSIESENIQLAAAYLGWLLDETEGDTSATLAAFFDGLTSQRNIPWRDDTVQYISEVLSLRPVFDPRAAVDIGP